jgi:hypothetical protein
MKTILKIISLIGLLFTIVPSFFVFNGLIDKQKHFIFMGIGLALWFATSPFWMKSQSFEE